MLDVIPGSIANPIDINSSSMLPVAVVGTDYIPAANVDVATLLFGDPILVEAGATPVSPVMSAIKDVTDDGLPDLLLHFSIPDMVTSGVLGPTTRRLRLTGSLIDGNLIAGTEYVAVPEPATLLIALLAYFAVYWRGLATRS